MAKRVKKLHATTRPTVSRGKPKHSRIINAARNSNTSIKRLADKIPAAIFIFQGNKNRFVNPSAEALTGYTRKELLEMDFWQILHPDYKDLVKERGFARQKGASVPSRYEVRIIRKDGEERWLDYTGGSIKFRSEMAVIGTAIDITERKRAEAQIQRNLSRTRALHETNLAVTSTLDLKGVLDVLLESIERFLSCAVIGAIRIINPQTGSPEPKAFRNIRDEDWKKTAPRGGRGLSKEVLEHKSPVAVLNGLADPRTEYPEFFRAFGLVSYLGVPLIANEKVLGDISLFTKEPHRFSDDEVDFVSTLAAQAAVAIQHSALFEEMQQKTRQLSALNVLIAAATRSLDLNSTLQEAAKAIIDLFHFDGARVYLFNESMDAVHLRASFEVKSGPFSPVRVARTGEGLVGRVAKTGEMLIFEDIQTDSRYPQLSQSSGAKKSGARFFAVFPIQSKLKSWGALVCIGEEKRRLATEETDLLVTLCNHAAIAIENATLFQQTAEKARELSALYSVAASCAELLDVNALMRQSIRKALEIFGFSAARIYVVDKKKQEIRLVAQDGFSANIISPSSYQFGEGLIGKVVDTGLPLTFEDMQSDPEYRRLARAKTMLKAGFRASLFIPLRVRGETLGVMNLVSENPHTFSTSDMQLINAIAYHLGVAIGNANIFSELRQKTQDLEKANKAKDEFLSVMSHELRTPLNVIMGYMQLIQDEVFGNLSADQQKAFMTVTKQTQSLLTMIEEILVATRIETGSVKLERKDINITEFFDELKSSYDLAPRKDFRLVWNIPSDLPPLNTDDGKLKHILQNLIDNAIKFTKKGRVTISVRNVAESKAMEFSVEDTGIGIEREHVPAIFKMFQQVDSSQTRTYGGVGLGLYIVKKFTELLGGTVTVESEPGEGSIFRVAIPFK